MPVILRLSTSPLRVELKLLLHPGFLFEVPIFEAQTRYPDFKFILLTVLLITQIIQYLKQKRMLPASCILRKNQVILPRMPLLKTVYDTLGFMGGMAVPSSRIRDMVISRGAEDAAKEFGLLMVPYQDLSLPETSRKTTPIRLLLKQCTSRVQKLSLPAVVL